MLPSVPFLSTKGYVGTPWAHRVRLRRPLPWPVWSERRCRQARGFPSRTRNCRHPRFRRSRKFGDRLSCLNPWLLAGIMRCCFWVLSLSLYYSQSCHLVPMLPRQAQDRFAWECGRDTSRPLRQGAGQAVPSRFRRALETVVGWVERSVTHRLLTFSRKHGCTAKRSKQVKYERCAVAQRGKRRD